MIELVFLSVLAIIWLTFAVIQDLKHREIANWLNFSLIVFALGFRFFYSLFSGNGYSFFYQGLIGLGIFIILGHALYYGRLFAGGDAKLMMSLGAVLPFYSNFLQNIDSFLVFLFIFFFTGAAFSILVSAAIGLKNFTKFKKTFSKIFTGKKNLFYISIFLAISVVVIGFLFYSLFVFLGILIFVLPYLYVYAKAVDESCMVKNIKTEKLTEGDWLYHDVNVGKKTLKASWHGLSKSEISLLKKNHKYVKIRQGIPFSPVFLIGFIIWLIYLRNSFW